MPPKSKSIDDVIATLVPVTESGCWLWPRAANEKGYGIARIDGKAGYVHRFVYEWKSGVPIPDGMQVRHSCDTPACANPDHLSVGTAKDNAGDRESRGRARQIAGLRHHNSRLGESAVMRIFTDGRPNATVAAEHGVSKSHVRNIKCGLRWSHITTPTLKESA